MNAGGGRRAHTELAVLAARTGPDSVVPTGMPVGTGRNIHTTWRFHRWNTAADGAAVSQDETSLKRKQGQTVLCGEMRGTSERDEKSWFSAHALRNVRQTLSSARTKPQESSALDHNTMTSEHEATCVVRPRISRFLSFRKLDCWIQHTDWCSHIHFTKWSDQLVGPDSPHQLFC